jgi:hypothetical protein
MTGNDRLQSPECPPPNVTPPWSSGGSFAWSASREEATSNTNNDDLEEAYKALAKPEDEQPLLGNYVKEIMADHLLRNVLYRVRQNNFDGSFHFTRSHRVFLEPHSWILCRLLWHYLPIYGSTALVDLVRFFNQFLNLYTVGRNPWMGISPSQGRYLHTGQQKNRINEHRNSCLEWNSNPRFQCWRGDGSCLRPRSHCEWLTVTVGLLKSNWVSKSKRDNVPDKGFLTSDFFKFTV